MQESAPGVREHRVVSNPRLKLPCVEWTGEIVVEVHPEIAAVERPLEVMKAVWRHEEDAAMFGSVIDMRPQGRHLCIDDGALQRKVQSSEGERRDGQPGDTNTGCPVHGAPDSPTA